MNTELVCVMASLGFSEGDKYFKGADCFESLKDLIRFLRREDETCNIRRQMGDARLLQKDLIPILMHYGDDDEMVDIVMRLLVNLTSPADICFNKHTAEAEEGVGRNKVTHKYQTKYLQVVSYLQDYKQAFTDEKVLASVGAQLGRILQMDFEDRGEDETLLFERMLLLLRNMLHVPASPNEEKRTDDDASLHDQILWSMHLNGIDDLIVYISSSPDEERWVMHAIEIVQLMLRELTPEKLAQSSKNRTESEKAEDTKALLLAREKENIHKKVAGKKMTSSRHSRFGGTFWVKNMKGVGNKNTLVQHHHVASVDDISSDHKKFKAKVPKRRQAAKETVIERTSTLNIRLFLKEFCDKFLENSYNHLMRIVKANVVAKRSQENDDTYYLWSLRFFMAFNRAHSFKVEYVRETLNMDTFHYVLKQINTYYDNFFMHKRGGWEPWQKRLHLSIQAYKELLTYISHMDKSNDHVLKDASSVMKNNVFYHEEYRSVFLMLLRHFDQSKQTKKYIGDLIDTFHVFLKLLEMFCKNKGTLLVKSKKRVAKRRRKTKAQQQAAVQMTAEQLDELWENDLAPNLSALIQGHDALPTDVSSPFDISSDVPVEEQRINAMINIQDHLRSGRCGEGVALLRAARECWPDEEKFGTENIQPENEFMVVRNILFQELERPAFQEENEEEEGNEEVEEEEGEEEEMPSVRSVEREFHLQQFLTSLASPHIIIPYNYLLKSFKTNTPFTNHAIIKVMHRVAVDLKYPEMLFQLSLFLTFKQIFDTQTSQFKELATFAKYIISKFVDATTKKPNMFVETLFWKGGGDCYQLSEREPVAREGASNKAREKWTFEDEEELKTLFDQYKKSEDVVGEILKSVTDKDRTRRQITNKLVRLRLVENSKQLQQPKKPKARDWLEEQTEELHRLYDEFKPSDDPVGNIMNALTFNKSKNAIIKQLLATGKVSDRKELHKKRKKKNREFKELVNNEKEVDSDSDSSSSSGSSDDSDEEDNEMPVEKEASHSRSLNISEESEEDETLSNLTTLVDLSKHVKENGYSQQIIWLQTRLRRAAEGREEDSDWYAVPLLTMTEEDENALHDKFFKKLLKMIGVKPPEDEQEAFWRIPDNLSPDNLRRFADELDNKTARDSTNNTSTAPQEVTTAVAKKDKNENTSASPRKTSLKNARKEKLKLLMEKRREEKLQEEKSRKERRNDRDTKQKKNKEIISKKKVAEKKTWDSSSSDDDNLIISERENSNTKRMSRGLAFLDSDDESDDDASLGAKKNLFLDETSKKVESEQNEDMPVNKDDSKGVKRGRQLSDSDEGEDEPVASKKKKKKRIVEEEEEEIENETQDVDDSIPLRDLLAQSVNTTDDATEKIKGDRDNSNVTTKLDHSMETGGESLEHEESALNFSLRISDDEDVIR